MKEELREILGLDHEPYVGVKHCSNCLQFNAILAAIKNRLPKESHIDKRFSTSEIDRFAYDFAFNSCLQQVKQALDIESES